MYKFTIFLFISCLLAVNPTQGANDQDKVIKKAFDYCLAKIGLSVKTINLSIFFTFVGDNTTNRTIVRNSSFGKLPTNQQNAMNQEQFKNLVIEISDKSYGGDVVKFLTEKMV